jgi:hypothetical protein
MAYVNATRSAERDYSSIVKIPVIAAKHIRIATLGRLHYMEVIGVAQGRIGRDNQA